MPTIGLSMSQRRRRRRAEKTAARPSCGSQRWLAAHPGGSRRRRNARIKQHYGVSSKQRKEAPRAQAA